MKKFFIFFFSISIVSISSAQLVVQGVDNATMNSFTKTDEMRKALNASNSRQATGFDNRYEGVQGSPFLIEDWLEGTLTLYDSAVVKDKIKYKFELINNTIWIKLGTGEERIIYSRELLSLELTDKNNKHYLIKKVKLPDIKDKDHFSIILFENENMTLVKDVKKVFRKANLEDKGIVTVGKAYDWFEDVAKYYVKTGNKSYFVETNLKKSNLISFAPKSHEKMIEQYCEKNNIRKNLSEEDAVKLVKFIGDLK